jgi:hypothetical protein
MSDVFKTLSDEICNIEKSLYVNDYKVDNIHLWPIYRLAYYIQRKKTRNNHTKNSLFQRIKNYLIFKYLATTNSKKSFNTLTKIVFLGSNSHRIKDDRGIYVNKFFNSISSQVNHIVEYDNLILNLDNNSVSLNSFISKSSRPSKKFIYEIKKLSTAIKLITSKKIDFDRIELFVINVLSYYNRIYPTLKKSNIQKVYVCSYYSQPALGFVIAANQLGIKTIEVQHGPIGLNHLAYSNWNNLPQNEKYLAIPSEIHIWHKNFNFYLSNIFENVKVTGNYYLKNFKIDNINYEKSVFLITLQPMDDKLPNIYFRIIEKYYEKFKIVIRTHPRQNRNSLFKQTKKRLEIKYNVSYHSAKEKSIVEILLKTKIHFTGYSGTFFEALELNVPTLFFNSLALNFFSNFKNDHNCWFCHNMNFNSVDFVIKKNINV